MIVHLADLLNHYTPPQATITRIMNKNSDF